MEVRLVHVVERLVELQVCTEHLHGDNIIHGETGLLDGLLETVHHHVSFLLSVRRRHTCFRIEPNMSGDVERVANQDGIAERHRAQARGTWFHDVLPVGGGCRQTEGEQQDYHSEFTFSHRFTSKINLNYV